MKLNFSEFWTWQRNNDHQTIQNIRKRCHPYAFQFICRFISRDGKRFEYSRASERGSEEKKEKNILSCKSLAFVMLKIVSMVYNMGVCVFVVVRWKRRLITAIKFKSILAMNIKVATFIAVTKQASEQEFLHKICIYVQCAIGCERVERKEQKTLTRKCIMW